MARTLITKIDIPAAGYNLTDSGDFVTLTAGSGNGVEFVFNANDRLLLKNDTGGAATFTLKVPPPSPYSGRVTIPDETVPVADGKTWVYKLAAIFKQSDGKVYVECDVAGKVLLLR